GDDERPPRQFAGRALDQLHAGPRAAPDGHALQRRLLQLSLAPAHPAQLDVAPRDLVVEAIVIVQTLDAHVAPLPAREDAAVAHPPANEAAHQLRPGQVALGQCQALDGARLEDQVVQIAPGEADAAEPRAHEARAR